MCIPADATGKMTHTYIDAEISGEMIDYNGVPGEYHELSYINLEKASFEMSIAREYTDYILGLREMEGGL
jgi:hypothetical protein